MINKQFYIQMNETYKQIKDIMYPDFEFDDITSEYFKTDGGAHYGSDDFYIDQCGCFLALKDAITGDINISFSFKLDDQNNINHVIPHTSYGRTESRQLFRVENLFKSKELQKAEISAVYLNHLTTHGKIPFDIDILIELWMTYIKEIEEFICAGVYNEIKKISRNNLTKKNVSDKFNKGLLDKLRLLFNCTSINQYNFYFKFGDTFYTLWVWNAYTCTTVEKLDNQPDHFYTLTYRDFQDE